MCWTCCIRAPFFSFLIVVCVQLKFFISDFIGVSSSVFTVQHNDLRDHHNNTLVSVYSLNLKSIWVLFGYIALWSFMKVQVYSTILVKLYVDDWIISVSYTHLDVYKRQDYSTYGAK